MNFNPYKAWLGISKPSTVAGLHITADQITLIVLQNGRESSDRTRLLAVGREAVPNGAVVGSEVRAVTPIVSALNQLMSRTRVAPGTPTVATIEPLAATAAIADQWEQREPACAVSRESHDRIADIVTGAGLELARIDVVPAALARFGRQLGWDEVALRSPSGWSVLTGPFFTDAERLVGRQPTTLLAGRDFGEAMTLDGFAGIDVPTKLESFVDPGTDAVAVGAALAGFGQGPLVSVKPVRENLPPPPTHRTRTITLGAWT